MQQLHISSQLFNFGYDIMQMHSVMHKYYVELIKIPRSYFSALGSARVRDLLLPYCQGIAAPESRQCYSIPSEIVAAMPNSDKYTVYNTAKHYTILVSQRLPERIIVNYRSVPQYIELPRGTTARVISNNVLLISNDGPQYLIYIGEKVVCVPARGNAKNEYSRWGTHGVRITIHENAELFDGVMRRNPTVRTTCVYYEFRLGVYFWRS